MPDLNKLIKINSITDVWIRCKVYEMSHDTATNTIHPLIKQDNLDFLALSISTQQFKNINFNYIKNKLMQHDDRDRYYRKLYQIPNNIETKWLKVFPLMNDNGNEYFDYTVISGVTIEEIYNDPNKPICVMNDTSVENTTKEIEKALTPNQLLVPFHLCIPHSPKYSVDLITCYMPPESITHYDSSKSEKDPFLDNASTPADPKEVEQTLNEFKEILNNAI